MPIGTADSLASRTISLINPGKSSIPSSPFVEVHRKEREMNLAKVSCTALIALIAMAFVGSSSAAAEATRLCHTNENPCSNPITELHLVSEQFVELSSVAEVGCEKVSARITPLALGAPQQLHVTELVFEHCGYGSTDNCEIETEVLPLLSLLKAGSDYGVVTNQGGQIRMACEDVFGFLDINCKYMLVALEAPMEGASNPEVGNGRLSLENLVVEVPGGSGGGTGGLSAGFGGCPGTAEWHASLEASESFYVMS
jgi:hypothetical protein